MSILRINSLSDLSPGMAARNRGKADSVVAAGAAPRVPVEAVGSSAATAAGGNDAAARGEVKNYALGRLKTGERNKTESAYESALQARQIAGEVVWYRFEGVKLRLADNTFYTPDFAVMLANGQFELHEVKGFWADDARVKIKVAADQYPFRFIAVMARSKRDGGGWKVEEF
jgi:hypothetical protein